MRKALITGISGQDGLYLARFLIDRNYVVYGICRNINNIEKWKIDYLSLADKIIYLEADLKNREEISEIVKNYKFDEIYNLAAQSNVGESFKNPADTFEVNIIAVLNLLEAIRNFSLTTRFFQASTAEIFSGFQSEIITEDSSYQPTSPYGISKLSAHLLTNLYRKVYGLFCCNAILFAHESALRGDNFVTRKITSHLAKIKNNQLDFLTLGNIDSYRDWGFAGDYVEAMYLILNQKNADNYVISSGKKYSVREFVQIAAGLLGFKIKWQGEGENEIGIDDNSGKIIVKISSEFYRPTDPKCFIGDPSKIERVTGWRRKTDFNQMISLMVENDLKLQAS